MQMTLSPVKSNSGNITGFNFDGQRLVIQFKSGAMYEYTPETDNEAKILADFCLTCPKEEVSSGTFFNQNIKNNPKISCKKL